MDIFEEIENCLRLKRETTSGYMFDWQNPLSEPVIIKGIHLTENGQTLVEYVGR